ncbi:MAG: 2Fe-2S iron-sulfur cluster-binding protein [Sphaerochaetaceae bacterium]|jgi:carbon-monoxide dehydrogenase small subunit|nr:2Fe-2S iron-sulfur cluster-binding protein [Sphaerochaetaceae bacterium]MDD3941708.1 2Fe-2S iron-sulfur cluster-binding protein [Sphaerochaetaceae bacterium]MDX9939850.1 2Fe-2S iron-sulfur cluster-binding protein [Sphaerochaetaceae bacterium]
MANKLITCTINGKKKEYFVDVRSSLMEMLRGSAGLDSVKHGCDVGECGACTVLIDGLPYNSCIYLAIWAEGKTILTLEGLSDVKGAISDIQQAFIDEGAVQCGFCTPGFIMSSIPIITSEHPYGREEIRKQIAGNLCRCTGYVKIVDAIEKTQKKRIRERQES